MNDMLKAAVAKMQEKNGSGDMKEGMKKEMESDDSQEIECPHCGKGITVELEASKDSEKDEPEE